MRPIWEAWFCHIEVNNICAQNCAYCTRYIRHLRKDQRFSMDLATFRKALISLDGFPGRVGIIGGEPLLHPAFEEICSIMKYEFKIPREKIGLWTSGGPQLPRYHKLINEVFSVVAYNEHSKQQRKTQLHQPLTISIHEAVKDKKYRDDLIKDCWVQKAWCPSINPKGGFFCEVAQAIDIILDGPGGYPIEPGWWLKAPYHFRDQVDRYCRYCGGAIPIKRELLNNKKQKFSPHLLALFKEHGLKSISPEFVDIYDRQLTIEEMEKNKLEWDPRHYRQDLSPDIKEGYKTRPLQPTSGPLLKTRGIQ